MSEDAEEVTIPFEKVREILLSRGNADFGFSLRGSAPVYILDVSPG